MTRAVCISTPLACLLAWICTIGVAGAAPDRQPHGWTTPEAPKPIEWSKLPADGGAVFGDWVIWRFGAGEEAALIVHQKTGLVIYLPWSSNGWLNYRNADGQSFVLWSRANPSPQERDYQLHKFAGKRPTVSLAAGSSTFGNWTATVEGDTIELHCKSMGCRMTIQRTVPVFTHNGRTIGGN